MVDDMCEVANIAAVRKVIHLQKKSIMSQASPNPLPGEPGAPSWTPWAPRYHSIAI